MEELRDVVISHGLLTGMYGDSGTAVALPVQPSVVAAPVPIEWDLARERNVEARLNRASDRKQFRFERDVDGGVAAVAITTSGADREHRFFKRRPVRVCLGGQTYRTKTAKGGRSIEVTIPGRGADLFHAMALLRRSHPRGLPSSGVIITAKFTNPTVQLRVREAAKKRLNAAADKTRFDPWSPAWDEPAGLVVGALCVSRLFHGNPKGRVELAHGIRAGLPEGIGQGDAVKELAVVWVSRIAVDAPYRGSGVGTALLDLLRTSIGATLPWQPRAIEVMQSVPSADATKASKFFTDAQYEYVLSTPTARTRLIDATGRPQTEFTSLRSLYYWAKIEPPT